MQEQTVVVLPDLHIRAPFRHVPAGHDKKVLKKVIEYIGTLRPDLVIQLGDFFDFPQFSEKYSICRDQDEVFECTDNDTISADVDFWIPLREVYGGPVKILEGNHDYRHVTWVEKNPTLAKKIDFNKLMGFEQWGAAYIPHWRDQEKNFLKIGKARFIHGNYTTKYHTRVHAERYPGTNLFYGHVHDCQSYSPAIFPPEHPNVYESLGCLCVIPQPYTKGQPRNWQQAFSVFHFDKSGNFNHYTIRIVNGSFISPEGWRF